MKGSDVLRHRNFESMLKKFLKIAEKNQKEISKRKSRKEKGRRQKKYE